MAIGVSTNGLGGLPGREVREGGNSRIGENQFSDKDLPTSTAVSRELGGRSRCDKALC